MEGGPATHPEAAEATLPVQMAGAVQRASRGEPDVLHRHPRPPVRVSEGGGRLAIPAPSPTWVLRLLLSWRLRNPQGIRLPKLG